MQDEGTPELIAARLANVGHGGDRSKGSIEPLTTQEKAAKLLNVSRRIGAMLREMEKNPGTLSRGCSLQPRDDTPTLADLGIEKTASHRWQTMQAKARQASTQGNKQTGTEKFSAPEKGRAADKVAAAP